MSTVALHGLSAAALPADLHVQTREVMLFPNRSKPHPGFALAWSHSFILLAKGEVGHRVVDVGRLRTPKDLSADQVTLIAQGRAFGRMHLVTDRTAVLPPAPTPKRK